MLEIINSQVYYDGKVVKDPLMIGLAFMDFAETVKEWKPKGEYINIVAQ